MTADSRGFLDALRGLPEQLAAAHEAALGISRSDLPSAADVDHVVVVGMGASGIVGDVLNAVASGELPVPVTVLKQMRTPAFVGPRSLVFALSYSGDTEETLSMATGCLDAGAHLVAVTCGGELGARARSRGGMVVPCPEGLSSSAALGALVAPLLCTLYSTGLMPDAQALLVKAQEQLARRRDACRPEVEGAANPAREIARRIDRTIPLIYGGGALGAVAAYRWKCDVNEKAKAPAFWNALPELDHNEICGWGQHGDVTRQVFTLVELRHGFEHDRLAPRFAITTELVEEALNQIISVDAEGEGRLAQVLDLMYLGDWVSCYLALTNDVDPGPLDAIAQLKERLRV